jgi:hypothetical protein
MFEMMIGYPPFYSDDPLTTCRKIVNWRMFLKFPEEIQVSLSCCASLGPWTWMGAGAAPADGAVHLACQEPCPCGRVQVSALRTPSLDMLTPQTMLVVHLLVCRLLLRHVTSYSG